MQTQAEIITKLQQQVDVLTTEKEAQLHQLQEREAQSEAVSEYFAYL